jgi:hypothetical protein
VKYDAFEKAAHAAYREIPREYREGVDGLVVSREALPHPTLPDVYTLGHCLTEDHLSDFGGPDTTRSVIALYWGSFHALARLDPDFDWEGELWETLTHELRHHLESLAREDDLEGVDYAADETFKRDEGLGFDPWYYQHGDDLGGGVYRVERDIYIELPWSQGAWEQAAYVEFPWHGRAYRFVRPEELGDVHFVLVHGLDTGAASLEVVLVRKRSWWEDVKRLVGNSRPVVHESEAVAEPVAAEG